MNLRSPLCFAALLCVTLGHAATLTVTSLADSGTGSLRAVVASAASGDTINITATGIITLTSSEIAVTKAMSIIGARRCRVDRERQWRVAHFQSLRDERWR